MGIVSFLTNKISASFLFSVLEVWHQQGNLNYQEICEKANDHTGGLNKLVKANNLIYKLTFISPLQFYNAVRIVTVLTAAFKLNLSDIIKGSRFCGPADV